MNILRKRKKIMAFRNTKDLDFHEEGRKEMEFDQTKDLEL